MPKEERLGIEIDGQPVCEVDARGSQLSIVAALAGVQQLPGDPYQIGPLAAFDRAVVKDAVTATLGTGKLRKAWPRGMERAEDMGQITAALVSAHPYVRDLPGLLGIPAKQVALRLQNLEADCLTRAMRALWALGVPVVPIHDGLLAPASDVQAVAAALREGYLTATGASIQTTVEYG
jgi:hypothetical protein